MRVIAIQLYISIKFRKCNQISSNEKKAGIVVFLTIKMLFFSSSENQDTEIGMYTLMMNINFSSYKAITLLSCFLKYRTLNEI